MPPLPALRFASARQCQLNVENKERPCADQGNFSQNKWRTGERPRRADHSGSGPRPREEDSHTLLPEGLERGGSLPRVHGGVGWHRPSAAGLHHAHPGGHVNPDHLGAACVSNGHCELQAMAQELGITHVRYSYNNPRLAVDMTHPRFVLDQNRCILCTRCVRVCAEVEGAHVWEVSSRGIYSRIVSDLKDDWGKASNCTGCGKCVQVCPTGALAEKGQSVMEMVKHGDDVSRLATQKAASANGAR